MQTFNQSLASLYFKKQITLEMATARSSNTDELQDLINRGAAALQTAQARAPGYPAQGTKPQAPLGRVGR
jgi:twitching motility protein PilT